jgi:hypothetical protein
MREIKLRVWLIKPKCYMHTDTLLDVFVGELNKENGRDWIVEQYTGLKDKNGIEIYENDRVTFETDYNSKGFTYVLWHDRKAMFTDMIGRSLGELDCLEVVGNSHEDTDLIEKR